MMVRQFLSDQSGASAAEMALILPMLIVLMFGGMEAGYYFWSEHKVVKAVRDGARYAGRLPVSTYSCPANPGFGAAGSITDAAAETRISNLTRTGTINGQGQPVIPGWTDDNNGTVDKTNQLRVVVQCFDKTGDASASVAANTGMFESRNDVIRVRVVANTAYEPLFSTLGFDTASIGLAASSESIVMGM